MLLIVVDVLLVALLLTVIIVIVLYDVVVQFMTQSSEQDKMHQVRQRSVLAYISLCSHANRPGPSGCLSVCLLTEKQRHRKLGIVVKITQGWSNGCVDIQFNRSERSEVRLA